MNDETPNTTAPKKLALPMILLIVGSMVLALLIVSFLPEWMPVQASTFAGNVDFLYYFIYWVSVFFTLLIAGTLVFFLLFYKQTDKAAAAPGKVTHSTALELTWTIIPVFIVLAIFAFGFKFYADMAVAPSGSDEVIVYAKQWGWQFGYPNDYLDNHLHIVADHPAKMIMQSSDVIHSLYIKQFRAKKDVVPGRFNTMWFQSDWDENIYEDQLGAAQKQDAADEKKREKDKAEFDKLKAAAETGDEAAIDAFEAFPFNDKGAFSWTRPDPDPRTTDLEKYGKVMVFDLYCTEYCGQSHAQMNRKVYVHETREGFEAWLEDASFIPGRFKPIEHAKNIWAGQCATCHTVDGSSNTGPTWKNLYGTQREMTDGSMILGDENYIRDAILYPQKHIRKGYENQNMASFSQLKDLDLFALVQYMKELSDAYQGDEDLEDWGEFGVKPGEGESATTDAEAEPAE